MGFFSQKRTVRGLSFQPMFDSEYDVFRRNFVQLLISNKGYISQNDFLTLILMPKKFFNLEKLKKDGYTQDLDIRRDIVDLDYYENRDKKQYFGWGGYLNGYVVSTTSPGSSSFYIERDRYKARYDIFYTQRYLKTINGFNSWHQVKRGVQIPVYKHYNEVSQALYGKPSDTPFFISGSESFDVLSFTYNGKTYYQRFKDKIDGIKDLSEIQSDPEFYSDYILAFTDWKIKNIYDLAIYTGIVDNISALYAFSHGSYRYFVFNPKESYYNERLVKEAIKSGNYTGIQIGNNIYYIEYTEKYFLKDIQRSAIIVGFSEEENESAVFLYYLDGNNIEYSIERSSGVATRKDGITVLKANVVVNRDIQHEIFNYFDIKDFTQEDENSIPDSVKDMMITFVADESENSIHQIYGFKNFPYTVKWSVGSTEVTQEYDVFGTQRELFTNRIVPLSNVEGDKRFIYPVIEYKKSLRDRYKAIQDNLYFVVYTEETIKLAWYQSGFFSFLTKLIAIYTQQYWLLYLDIAKDIAISRGWKEVAEAISIIELAYSTYLTAGKALTTGSVINRAYAISKVSMKIVSYYLDLKTKRMQSQAISLMEQEKETEKEIRKLKDRLIYSPYEAIDYGYEIDYDLLYNFDRTIEVPNLDIFGDEL